MRRTCPLVSVEEGTPPAFGMIHLAQWEFDSGLVVREWLGSQDKLTVAQSEKEMMTEELDVSHPSACCLHRLIVL